MSIRTESELPKVRTNSLRVKVEVEIPNWLAVTWVRTLELTGLDKNQSITLALMEEVKRQYDTLGILKPDAAKVEEMWPGLLNSYPGVSEDTRVGVVAHLLSKHLNTDAQSFVKDDE